MAAQESSTAAVLEKAYRDALARFKADKANKDLRRARTAAKKAWDQALLKENEGAQQLVCRDCSQTFLWTTEEQDYYKASEWNHKPQRCRKCAESQKARRRASYQLLQVELGTNETGTTCKKAGKNMCYAFQRGECPYGDKCKFNHDPEFAGGKNKGEERKSNNDTDEGVKKRKVVPEVIAICKWGKDCKIKKCRYRHDVGEGDSPQQSSVPAQTKPIHKVSDDDNSNSNTADDETKTTCTTVPNAATTMSKKPKVMGICKWGKNCKIKRCRFQHPDDSSPTLLENPKNSGVPTAGAPTNVTGTSEKAVATTTSIAGTTETESKKTKSKSKSKSESKTKSSDKLVHKAMKKALKKAPNKKLRVKDLRKLVRKQMEAMGKDEVKLVVTKAIANHKDSMTLLENGTFVKLLV